MRKLTVEEINERIADRGITCIRYAGRVVDKSTLRCSEGHEWEARASDVMGGNGCPYCAGVARLTIDVINERIADRGIVCVWYAGKVTDKSTFRCNDGYEWEAMARSVIRGSGCPHCAGVVPLTIDIVNERIADIGLVCVWYAGNVTDKSRFRCEKGHESEVAASNIMRASGCPHCFMPNGERWMSDILNSYGIDYTHNSVPDCLERKRVDFQVHIELCDYWVEIDGAHHFKPVDYGGKGREWAIEYHERTVISDQMKDETAVRNGIPIIRISRYHLSEEQFKQVADYVVNRIIDDGFRTGVHVFPPEAYHGA